MNDCNIEKDLFTEIYKNNSNKDTAKYFNITVYSVLKLVKEFELIPHTKQENCELTCLKKYGTKNVFQNDNIKNKCADTKKEKYGDSNFNNPQKRKNTCLEKYGTPSASGNVEIQNKVRQTNLERYGVDNQFKRVNYLNDCIVNKYGSLETFYNKKQKSLENSMRRLYGVANISQVPENRKMAIEKGRNTLYERYGVTAATLLPQVIFSKGNHALSKPNIRFAELLNNNNINYEQEFTIVRYSYDFKVGNSLIEINPFATHNSTWSPFGDDNIKEKDYHLKKTLTAKENGYRCIHIWDWDNVDKVISLLKDRETIYGRKCEVKEINDKKQIKDFLNTYHLQGYAKSEIEIGLFYNDELVSIMTFGKPRYNKNYQYELIRYCSKYNVIGGAEKLFKFFLKEHKPETIISYCDNSKFDGSTYIKLGFELKDYGVPTRHWYEPITEKHITDNLLRQRGFDQLFGTNYGKGTSNEQLMLEHGFVEIYDCGQSSYIYKNK